MHHLRLLGSPSIEGPSGPLGGRVAQPRRLALLALLAVEHPRPVSRDRLLAYLLPESPSDRARHLLRDSVYVLRASLGDDAILAAADDLRLNDARISCDLWEFEDAFRSGRHEAAIHAYGGPLLQGFHLGGAGEFDRWLAEERGSLARRYSQAIESLAEERALGDARGAVELWQKLVSLDPYDSRLAVRLMLALEAAGNRIGALRHAAAHHALLREEFEAQPDPEVESLAERLRCEPVATPSESAERGERTEPPPGVPGATSPAARGGADTVVRPGTAATRIPSWRSARRRTAVLGIGGATILLTTAVHLLRGTTSLDPERIVVAAFDNRTGDPALDMIGGMAADWIAQGLAHAGVGTVVPIEVAMGSSRYAAPASAGPGDASNVRWLGAETGARTVITGAIYRGDDELRLLARLTDARSGRLLVMVGPISGRAEAPLEAVEQLRQRVLSAAAQLMDSRLTAAPGAFGRPPTYAAYQEYLAGLEMNLVRDWEGAIERFQVAASLDTAWVIPRLIMATAYANLNDVERADTIARIVERSREQLTPVDRVTLALVQAWVRRDRIAAYEAAHTGARLAPGSMLEVQAGFEAAKMNRPREAVRELSRLDPDRGILRDYTWYWDILGRAHHHLGEHRRELRVAREARRRFPSDPFVLATELRALAALGRAEEVERLATEFLHSAQRRADGTGHALTIAALELRAHGQPAAARRLFDQAIGWSRARNAAEPWNTTVRSRLGELLYLTERWEEAREVFVELADLEPDNVDHRAFLGRIAARLGDDSAAEATARWLEEHPSPYRVDERTYQRARIAAVQGNQAAATALLREALAQGMAYNIQLHVCVDFEPLRAYPPYLELLWPKG